jgi:DNA polymerase III epsilon subunit-like protein
MRILLFDTETNGLPKRWNASIADVENWPAILSIAWQIWDFSAPGAPVRIETQERLLNPSPAIVWDAEAATIHGMSLELLRTEGQPPTAVFPEFMEKARTCDVIVAHNLSFDKSVVIA